MMSEQELRQECLRLAHLHGELTEMTIKRAEAYLRFVMKEGCDEQDSESATG